MAYSRRQQTVGTQQTVTFISKGKVSYENIDEAYSHCFIDIISLDDNNDSSLPTTGTYTPFVRLQENGSWHDILNNGVRSVINATSTGGELTPDGAAEIVSFVGNPYEIKIVPSDVDVATKYKVSIMQNKT